MSCVIPGEVQSVRVWIGLVDDMNLRFAGLLPSQLVCLQSSKVIEFLKTVNHLDAHSLSCVKFPLPTPLPTKPSRRFLLPSFSPPTFTTTQQASLLACVAFLPTTHNNPNTLHSSLPYPGNKPSSRSIHILPQLLPNPNPDIVHFRSDVHHVSPARRPAQGSRAPCSRLS